MKDLKNFKILNSGLLYLLGLAVAVIAGMMICPPVLYLNDDTVMRSILNGSYTGCPDGHAVYMQYPLTGILTLCYRVFPQIPWLEVFFTVCILSCMVLFVRTFQNKVCGFAAAIALMLPFYIYMHYTLVAAVVAAVAVFLLSRSDKKLLSVLLLWIAYMIRSQVGLLCLPFAGAACVWRVLQNREQVREEAVGLMKVLVSLVTGFLLIAGGNHLCYSSEDWQEYFAYNEGRTQLYDYTNFLTAEKYLENYQDYGMNQEEAWILRMYYTMLDGSIDSRRMQEIADTVTVAMWEEMNTADVIKNCLAKYFYQIRFEHMPYNLLWGALYLVLIIGTLVCGKWLETGFLGVLLFGRSAVWLFLLWKDRFPERVALSLYVIELILLISVALVVAGDVKKRFLQGKPNLQKITIVLLACGCLLFGAFRCKEAYDNAVVYTKAQGDWLELKAYCGENAEITYLLDVFSIGIYMEPDESPQLSNMFLVGGWLTESPLAKKRMKELGGADIAEVLYKKEDVRLLADISQDMSWLQEYLQKRFGDCKLVATKKIISGWRAIIEYEVQ